MQCVYLFKLQLQLDASFNENTSLKKLLSDRENEIERQISEIEDMKNKEREHETVRRKLHNTIQELKVSSLSC